jgi:hypothetical protein
MGLMNIQGQVQDVVIGSLLILSILMPRARHLAALRSARRDTLIKIGAGLVIALIFGWFFWWSRTLIAS